MRISDWSSDVCSSDLAHREKLRVIGRENDLEKMNRQALRLARDVARRNGCLMAGNICNTNAYETDDSATHAKVRAMFEEQIGWAVEEGADFLIDRKSTRLNSSHSCASRIPSSA